MARMTKAAKVRRARAKERDLVEELKGALSAYGYDEGGEYTINVHLKKRKWSMDLVCSCCGEGTVAYDAFTSRTQSGMLKKALAAVKDDGHLEGH